MMMSLNLSLMFMFMSHPLSYGIILMIQTITTAMITGLMTPNFWFSYILFLIMIGGMLILFIYMTSIASNEKFNFSINMLFSFIIIMMMSILMIMFFDNFFFNELNTSLNMPNYQMKMFINKFINFPSNMIMFLMIIYLFITLIAIVKITNINQGPLRKMN
uniref:NADH-ubiquinone oxidoreductase chain 6 n=1 Tax=Staphylinoidea sp. 8 KM-2017 TaxID=2219462 RepID=A0A346RI41_9COLE|nr:NADH dehydrogenase subunit 6 [Staphylinoidea sp. 8 KM-2017]